MGGATQRGSRADGEHRRRPDRSGGQGILFYLYSRNLAALREQLLADGIGAGEIVDGTPGPRQELRLADLDGYVLMVAQIDYEDTASTWTVSHRAV